MFLFSKLGVLESAKSPCQEMLIDNQGKLPLIAIRTPLEVQAVEVRKFQSHPKIFPVSFRNSLKTSITQFHNESVLRINYSHVSSSNCQNGSQILRRRKLQDVCPLSFHMQRWGRVIVMTSHP
jgi:hypothetical protein